MTTEITPKTSTNTTQYLYSWTGWKGFLATRKQRTGLKLQKILFVKTNLFSTFCLGRNLEVKNLN